MLNRLALRLATVRALRGRTLAGDNVLDSDMAPIEDIALEYPQPVIVVYTDDGKFMSSGRDLFVTSGDARVDVGFQSLVIEIVITQRMTMRDDDGNTIEGAVPPVLDAALEFNLDIIERQIYAALMDADPAAPWAEMWRRFVFGIGDRDSQRGSSKQDGLRLAGRQIKLSVTMPRDPAPGAPVGPLWSSFLALAATDAGLTPLLPMINACLAGTPLPPGLQTARKFGLTRHETDSFLLTPPGPPAAAPPEPPESGP